MSLSQTESQEAAWNTNLILYVVHNWAKSCRISWKSVIDLGWDFGSFSEFIFMYHAVCWTAVCNIQTPINTWDIYKIYTYICLWKQSILTNWIIIASILVLECTSEWIGITKMFVLSASKMPERFFWETVGIIMCMVGWCFVLQNMLLSSM